MKNILLSLFLIPLCSYSQNHWQVTNYNVAGRAYALTFGNDRIFAGNQNGRVHWSSDSGNSWNMINCSFNSVLSLTYKNSNQLLFVGTDHNGIWRTDGNSCIQKGFTGRTVPSVVVKNVNGYVFAICQSAVADTLFRSQNNGDSWIFLRWFSHAYTLFADQNGFVYAGTSEGLYYSSDDGNGWQLAGLSNEHVTAIAGNSDSTIVAGTWNGIFVTTNFGNNWIQSLNSTVQVNALLRHSGRHFFAGTDGAGMYESTENGFSWPPDNSGLFDNVIYSLSRDQIGYVYSGHNGRVCRTVLIVPSVKQISVDIPNTVSLSQNYPNPFNPSTSIRFDIAKTAIAKLSIFDPLGREIATLVNEEMNPGSYEVKWDAGNAASGVYFYRIQAGDFAATKKLLLLR